jgi:large subunit ribosomal protein L4
LIIHHEGASEKFLKSIKNIPNAKRLKVIGTNVYDLIKFQKVLFTKEALKTLQDRLTK